MNITIVLGTAREGRLSERAAFMLERQLAAKNQNATIIDVAQLDLEIFKGLHGKYEYNNPKLDEAKTQLETADAMIFVTPEYNGSIASSLKNFIDLFAKKPFDGKPIGVCTVSSGAMGGIRAAYQLQQIILSIFAYPQPRMLTIGNIQNHLDSEGAILTDDFAKKTEQFLSAFLGWAGKFIIP
ncbi:MAG: NAD(P)H-dependent oxidoreductase [Bacteroidetes bacterium]|nr:NAD(P)H-dependent oxidoreductase [Bacteroidota bacterium]